MNHAYWFVLTALAAVALAAVALRTFMGQLRAQQARDEQARRERAAALSVREAAGFTAGDDEVEIGAELVNAGEKPVRRAVVEAVVGGAVVAASRPVNLAAGASQRVALSIPRRHVEDVGGERPAYRGGELTLRVTAV